MCGVLVFQGIDEGEGHAVPFVLSQTFQEQKLMRNVPFLPHVLDQGWRDMVPLTLFSVRQLEETPVTRRKSETRPSVLTSLDGSGTILFVYLVSF